MGPFGGPVSPALVVMALVVGGLFLFAVADPFFGFFPFFLLFWAIPFFLVPALARHGELTPARAALETTLSVAEADRMLSGLAKDGHIEVRAREGRLGYALWEPDRRELTD